VASVTDFESVLSTPSDRGDAEGDDETAGVVDTINVTMESPPLPTIPASSNSPFDSVAPLELSGAFNPLRCSGEGFGLLPGLPLAFEQATAAIAASLALEAFNGDSVTTAGDELIFASDGDGDDDDECG
jgi:hypothetical protein